MAPRLRARARIIAEQRAQAHCASAVSCLTGNCVASLISRIWRKSAEASRPTGRHERPRRQHACCGDAKQRVRRAGRLQPADADLGVHRPPRQTAGCDVHEKPGNRLPCRKCSEVQCRVLRAGRAPVGLWQLRRCRARVRDDHQPVSLGRDRPVRANKKSAMLALLQTLDYAGLAAGCRVRRGGCRHGSPRFPHKGRWLHRLDRKAIAGRHRQAPWGCQ